jgi:hypothetical protein
MALESQQGGEIYLFSKSALEPTQSPSQWVSKFFPGIKRPGREVEHSSLSNSSKSKFTLEQAMKAQRGSRCIALLFL